MNKQITPEYQEGGRLLTGFSDMYKSTKNLGKDISTTVSTGVSDASAFISKESGADSVIKSISDQVKYIRDVERFHKAYSLSKSVYAMKEMHGLMILLTTYIVDKYLFGQDYMYTFRNTPDNKANTEILGFETEPNYDCSSKLQDNYQPGESKESLRIKKLEKFPINLYNSKLNENKSVVNNTYILLFKSIDAISKNRKSFEDEILVKLSALTNYTNMNGEPLSQSTGNNQSSSTSEDKDKCPPTKVNTRNVSNIPSISAKLTSTYINIITQKIGDLLKNIRKTHNYLFVSDKKALAKKCYSSTGYHFTLIPGKEARNDKNYCLNYELFAAVTDLKETLGNPSLKLYSVSQQIRKITKRYTNLLSDSTIRTPDNENLIKECINLTIEVRNANSILLETLTLTTSGIIADGIIDAISNLNNQSNETFVKTPEKQPIVKDEATIVNDENTFNINKLNSMLREIENLSNAINDEYVREKQTLEVAPYSDKQMISYKPKLYKPEIREIFGIIFKIVCEYNKFFNEVFVLEGVDRLETKVSMTSGIRDSAKFDFLLNYANNNTFKNFLIHKKLEAITPENTEPSKQTKTGADSDQPESGVAIKKTPKPKTDNEGFVAKEQPTIVTTVEKDVKEITDNEGFVAKEQPTIVTTVEKDVKAITQPNCFSLFYQILDMYADVVKLEKEKTVGIVFNTSYGRTMSPTALRRKPFPYNAGYGASTSYDENTRSIFNEVNEIKRYAIFFSVLLEKLRDIYVIVDDDSREEQYIRYKGVLHRAKAKTMDTLVPLYSGAKNWVSYGKGALDAAEALDTKFTDDETSGDGSTPKTGGSKRKRTRRYRRGIIKNPKRTMKGYHHVKPKIKTKRKNNKRSLYHYPIKKRTRYARNDEGGGLLDMAKSAASSATSAVSSVANTVSTTKNAVTLTFGKQDNHSIMFDKYHKTKYELLLYFKKMSDMYLFNSFKDGEITGSDNPINPKIQDIINHVNDMEIRSVNDEYFEKNLTRKYYRHNVNKSTQIQYGIGEISTQVHNFSRGKYQIMEKARRLVKSVSYTISIAANFLYKNPMFGSVALGLTALSYASMFAAMSFPLLSPGLLVLSNGLAILRNALSVALAPLIDQPTLIIQDKKDIMENAKKLMRKDTAGHIKTDNILREMIELYDYLYEMRTGNVARNYGIDGITNKDNVYLHNGKFRCFDFVIKVELHPVTQDITSNKSTDSEEKKTDKDYAKDKEKLLGEICNYLKKANIIDITHTKFIDKPIDKPGADAFDGKFVVANKSGNSTFTYKITDIIPELISTNEHDQDITVYGKTAKVSLNDLIGFILFYWFEYKQQLEFRHGSGSVIVLQSSLPSDDYYEYLTSRRKSLREYTLNEMRKFQYICMIDYLDKQIKQINDAYWRANNKPSKITAISGAVRSVTGSFPDTPLSKLLRLIKDRIKQKYVRIKVHDKLRPDYKLRLDPTLIQITYDYKDISTIQQQREFKGLTEDDRQTQYTPKPKEYTLFTKDTTITLADITNTYCGNTDNDNINIFKEVIFEMYKTIHHDVWYFHSENPSSLSKLTSKLTSTITNVFSNKPDSVKTETSSRDQNTSDKTKEYINHIKNYMAMKYDPTKNPGTKRPINEAAIDTYISKLSSMLDKYINNLSTDSICTHLDKPELFYKFLDEFCNQDIFADVEREIVKQAGYQYVSHPELNTYNPNDRHILAKAHAQLQLKRTNSIISGSDNKIYTNTKNFVKRTSVYDPNSMPITDVIDAQITKAESVPPPPPP
jgi:hypothetical protein